MIPAALPFWPAFRRQDEPPAPKPEEVKPEPEGVDIDAIHYKRGLVVPRQP